MASRSTVAVGGDVGDPGWVYYFHCFVGVEGGYLLMERKSIGTGRVVARSVFWDCLRF